MSTPAIPAVGAALLHIFFPVEGGVTVSAVSGFHDDARFIDKLHDDT